MNKAINNMMSRNINVVAKQNSKQINRLSLGISNGCFILIGDDDRVLGGEHRIKIQSDVNDLVKVSVDFYVKKDFVIMDDINDLKT